VFSGSLSKIQRPTARQRIPDPVVEPLEVRQRLREKPRRLRSSVHFVQDGERVVTVQNPRKSTTHAKRDASSYCLAIPEASGYVSSRAFESVLAELSGCGSADAVGLARPRVYSQDRRQLEIDAAS
jgi:hypothetical protein